MLSHKAFQTPTVLTRWEPQLNGNIRQAVDHDGKRNQVLTRWEPQLNGNCSNCDNNPTDFPGFSLVGNHN
jgi:hypothetical protein